MVNASLKICVSEMMMKGSLAGEDVEVVYLNCDSLEKDEFIKVYLLEPGANKQPFFIRWFYKKTLVFEYDPGSYYAALPVIRESGAKDVVISVPGVSSVLVQSKKWRDVSVRYEIGKIDYP